MQVDIVKGFKQAFLKRKQRNIRKLKKAKTNDVSDGQKCLWNTRKWHETVEVESVKLLLRKVQKGF